MFVDHSCLFSLMSFPITKSYFVTSIYCQISNKHLTWAPSSLCHWKVGTISLLELLRPRFLITPNQSLEQTFTDSQKLENHINCWEKVWRYDFSIMKINVESIIKVSSSGGFWAYHPASYLLPAIFHVIPFIFSKGLWQLLHNNFSCYHMPDTTLNTSQKKPFT